jgi:hypothetical protein
MSFDRQALADQAASLAAQGVYVGTSSWKYQGWCGMLYDRAPYEWRGKFAESRFKRECLAEYAEVFKTVCVDARRRAGRAADRGLPAGRPQPDHHQRPSD